MTPSHLARLLFRPGDLLTAADLAYLVTEQVASLRRHLFEVHRTYGVLTGLAVSTSPTSPALVVQPGMALDLAGRVLVLCKPVERTPPSGRGVVWLCPRDRDGDGYGDGPRLLDFDPDVRVVSPDERVEGVRLALMNDGGRPSIDLAGRPAAGSSYRRPFIATGVVPAGTTVKAFPPWGWEMTVNTRSAGFLPLSDDKDDSQQPNYFLRLGDGTENDVDLLRTGAVSLTEAKAALARGAPGPAHGPFVHVVDSQWKYFLLRVLYRERLDAVKEPFMASPLNVYWTGVEPPLVIPPGCGGVLRDLEARS
jgi:hypothetical protein